MGPIHPVWALAAIHPVWGNRYRMLLIFVRVGMHALTKDCNVM